MAPGFRQAITVCGPPCARFQMLVIEVEHVDITGGARQDADQRSRKLSPQFAQTIRVTPRLLEATRRSRTLISQAREAEPARTEDATGAYERTPMRPAALP